MSAQQDPRWNAEQDRPHQRFTLTGRRLLCDKRAMLSLFWLVGIVLLGLLAPLIAPYSPTAQSLGDTLLPPDAGHLLGTDDLGETSSRG